MPGMCAWECVLLLLPEVPICPIPQLHLQSLLGRPDASCAFPGVLPAQSAGAFTAGPSRLWAEFNDNNSKRRGQDESATTL